jgi:protein-disulfide isomerase-like protein with CxxC motif
VDIVAPLQDKVYNQGKAINRVKEMAQVAVDASWQADQRFTALHHRVEILETAAKK